MNTEPTESEIEEGIYHQIDNTARGFVDYSPRASGAATIYQSQEVPCPTCICQRYKMEVEVLRMSIEPSEVVPCSLPSTSTDN